MKILVAVKRVLDYNLKARVKMDGSEVDLTNLKMSMNPFDDIAVEEAVRLKEAGKADDITVVSVGTMASTEQIRSALALGADRGILVETPDTIEPLDVAYILTALVKRHAIDLVILGKQAIDNDCNQTGQMVAALLDWAQGTFISKVDIDGTTVHLTREIDGGLQKLSAPLPMVLTTDLRLNEPRYPKLPNIMKAKQKPLDIVQLADLNITLKTRHQTLKVCEPPTRQGGKRVESVQQLMEELQRVGGI